jgi:hypothetical protein
MGCNTSKDVSDENPPEAVTAAIVDPPTCTMRNPLRRTRRSVDGSKGGAPLRTGGYPDAGGPVTDASGGVAAPDKAPEPGVLAAGDPGVPLEQVTETAMLGSDSIQPALPGSTSTVRARDRIVSFRGDDIIVEPPRPHPDADRRVHPPPIIVPTMRQVATLVSRRASEQVDHGRATTAPEPSSLFPVPRRSPSLATAPLRCSPAWHASPRDLPVASFAHTSQSSPFCDITRVDSRGRSMGLSSSGMSNSDRHRTTPSDHQRHSISVRQQLSRELSTLSAQDIQMIIN